VNREKSQVMKLRRNCEEFVEKRLFHSLAKVGRRDAGVCSPRKTHQSKSLQFPHIFYIVSLQSHAKVDTIEERNRTMKKILLTLFTVIVVLGLFAAAGFTGYRFGYAQGVQAAANGDNLLPGLRPFDDFGPRGMPMHDFGFERGYPRGWDRGGFPMMGLGFFSPWILLGQIAVLALIVWFIYWLFARSGWRLTRQTTVNTSSKPEDE